MLSKDLISKRIISQLDDIGINSKIGNENSHTAKLVEIIVNEIITAIQTDAEVFTKVNVVTYGNASTQSGNGSGKGNIR